MHAGTNNMNEIHLKIKKIAEGRWDVYDGESRLPYHIIGGYHRYIVIPPNGEPQWSPRKATKQCLIAIQNDLMAKTRKGQS